jgi:TolA-binding protein
MVEMMCPAETNREQLERYLLGSLDDAERDAIEAHVFECDRCLDELQTIRALQGELHRQRTGILAEREPAASRWLVTLAAAAVLLAVVGGTTVWMRRGERSHTAPTPAAVRTISPPPEPPAGKPLAPETIVALSHIDPPPYVPFRVRGADATPSDFSRGMESYAKGNYPAAVQALRSALTRDPDSVVTNLFLGVSLFMSEDAVGSAERFQAVIATGDSPYEPLAHVLLAKALIRNGDLDQAERELQRSSVLPGGQDAANLLRRLRAARGGRN